MAGSDLDIALLAILALSLILIDIKLKKEARMLYSLIQLSFNGADSKFSLKVVPVENEREECKPHIVKAFNEVWVYCPRNEVPEWKEKVVKTYMEELVASRDKAQEMIRELSLFMEST